MSKGVIRLVHGVTKKHPKHVFLGLKFASLNKYSSGIWHPKQGFFFFKTLNKYNDVMILPLKKIRGSIFQIQNSTKTSQNLAKLP